MKRLLPLVLALVLLAGCQSPAAAPSYEVTVHWDALEGGQAPAPCLARHWYNQDPDDLIRLPRLSYQPD